MIRRGSALGVVLVTAAFVGCGSAGPSPSDAGAADSTVADTSAVVDSGAKPPLPDGAGACTTSADCGSALYCKKATCAATNGTCAPIPAFLTCIVDAGDVETCVDSGGGSTCTFSDPHSVCGCDHQTYTNSCEAASFGVDVAAKGECPPLPDGPCTSQAQCGGASYAALVFCDPTVCGKPAGQCAQRPAACSELEEYVCGCDGTTYLNSCFCAAAAVGVAYGGPCRTGTLVSCSTSHACSATQACVPDPRMPCGPNETCAGICVDTAGASCGTVLLNDAATTFNCIGDGQSQTCVSELGCGEDCATCVYTSDVTCGAGSPCPAGQLCMPTSVCGPDAGACASYCAVP